MSEVASLRAEADRLRGLLRIARCPNTGCRDGAIPRGPDPDGNWEAEQCQWCADRAAALDLATTSDTISTIPLPEGGQGAFVALPDPRRKGTYR